MNVANDTVSSAQFCRALVTSSSCTPYVYGVQETLYGVQLSSVSPTSTRTAARAGTEA